ncbi:AfsR/SARP family transcriptional regulator [Kineococcus rhizosphaerae]|uniref:DNA-binding SARP family transcriptional activator n=1 Tax=Kineococcus rhizosphaerae TaxID=559628 RepID=A0A2T0R1Y6_9ACTN|nr:AfsR/SARP family transcriptional regulator [Kineococcus rhizosphaerae]PRY13579.1 DNA-binding SARP family transcriptional activator [Kineococcus rhizosphaerae]
MDVRIGLLGPVVAWRDGVEVDLRGPRHRAVLARLAVAAGRTVPVDVLVEDLWTAPPAGALAAVRTFVAALRRSLEPDRAPRTPARVLVTSGTGYALRATTDAQEFSAAADEVPDLERALRLWRGRALDGLGDEPWLTAERTRLDDGRLRAVERLAAARLRAGEPDRAVTDLLAHTARNPWREEGWRVLGLAQAAAGRRAEALQTLRHARRLLGAELGLDPGPGLRAAEQRVLAGHPDPVRWPATVDGLRHLAVTGPDGLRAAVAGRATTLDAAETLEPRLAARVLGGFDVPALWSRADDPAQAARIVTAAGRLLARDPSATHRARLLATTAIERRGLGGARGPAAAAVRAARELGDPAVLVHALNASFLASFEVPGARAERAAIGAELVEVAARHEFWPHEVLGHLVLVQTHCATGDVDAAGRHVDRARELADLEGAPLVAVFEGWFEALRGALAGDPHARVLANYRRQVGLTEGMPGVRDGLREVAVAAAHVQHGRPVPAECAAGPWRAWIEPLALLESDPDAARRAVRAAGEPPPGHLHDLLLCFLARAAADLGERPLARGLLRRLEPVEDEVAGAGSGLVTAGPVAGFTAALRRLG